MIGIAPLVLKSQVEATAGWALDSDFWPAEVVRSAAAIEEAWRADPAHTDYARLLFAAHYLTVATFCPTDVDARIRHHVWVEADSARALTLVALVDEVAALDASLVSARTVKGPDGAAMSGHNGEWFSVRAGALGRALSLGEGELAARVEAQIEDELGREAEAFRAAVRENDVQAILEVSCIVAHNTGDLSRVVEAWPKSEAHNRLRGRFARLGHPEGAVNHGGVFAAAGHVNKAVTAVENHRFLGLRKARSLRRSRDLLLPIGPFFEPWGRRVALALDEPERVEVVDALMETHLRGEDQQGPLRALRGMAEANRGPWSKIVDALPVRLRKAATAGPVQAGLRVTHEAFFARLEKRTRAALESAPKWSQR
ncbi:MAG: hypothetical protein IPG50_33865 [Myxococcales bacterium]|nr:hypothetical protein [Myxococcales bacterium]